MARDKVPKCRDYHNYYQVTTWPVVLISYLILTWYFQWVPYLFILQGIMFLLPHRFVKPLVLTYYVLHFCWTAQTLGISGGRKDGSDRKGSEEREPERERESQRHQQNCTLHQSTGERARSQEVQLTWLTWSSQIDKEKSDIWIFEHGKYIFWQGRKKSRRKRMKITENEDIFLS